jgi:hypothetical protein
MAREAGLEQVVSIPFDGTKIVSCPPLPELERFAALVAAAERKECASLCDAIAFAAECNKTVCDESKLEFYSSRHLAADDCADLIRARGPE